MSKLCDSLSGHYSVKFNVDKLMHLLCHFKLSCTYHHAERDEIQYELKWKQDCYWVAILETHYHCVDDNEDILSQKRVLSEKLIVFN